MRHYWKKCPYCGKTIESGHGLLYKRFGDPIKTCRHCLKTYRDSSIIDWPTATLFQKVSFYLANGRFAFCLMLYLIAVAIKIGNDGKLAYLTCLPVLFVVFVLCVLYVQIRVRLYYGKDTEPINYDKLKQQIVDDDLLMELSEKYSKYDVEFLKEFIIWVDEFSSEKVPALEYLETLNGCTVQATNVSGLELCYKIHLDKITFERSGIAHMFKQLDAVIESENESEKQKNRERVINGLNGIILAGLLCK